jgi:hypothetical protein
LQPSQQLTETFNSTFWKEKKKKKKKKKKKSEYNLISDLTSEVKICGWKKKREQKMKRQSTCKKHRSLSCVNTCKSTCFAMFNFLAALFSDGDGGEKA